VELNSPLATVTPTLDGDVLAVLAGSDGTFTTGQLHRVLGRHSEEGIRKVLQRLVRQGVVHAERVGNAFAYRFNRDHLAAEHIIEPAAEEMPPVWTGSVGPKSLAVTGRIADGWMPGHAADWLSERYRTSRPLIDKAAVDAGREPADIATVYNFPGRITDKPLPSTRTDDGRWIGGSPAQWIEELTGAVLQHDAAGFVLFGPGGSTPDETTAARWAGEIVPAVREAVAK
jgi:alkanesulfonate monooxygenase SsuD/methylene tetrahydromethanopterin reductase-like flavin-dependent oxidoreductase (luciferase family)